MFDSRYHVYSRFDAILKEVNMHSVQTTRNNRIELCCPSDRTRGLCSTSQTWICIKFHTFPPTPPWWPMHDYLLSTTWNGVVIVGVEDVDHAMHYQAMLPSIWKIIRRRGGRWPHKSDKLSLCEWLFFFTNTVLSLTFLCLIHTESITIKDPIWNKISRNRYNGIEIWTTYPVGTRIYENRFRDNFDTFNGNVLTSVKCVFLPR